MFHCTDLFGVFGVKERTFFDIFLCRVNFVMRLTEHLLYLPCSSTFFINMKLMTIEDAERYFDHGNNLFDKRNYSEAIESFQEAASQDHAGAQYSLAMIYKHGMSVQQDEELAATWCFKSAEQGHVNAQYELSSMFTFGQGVQQDDELAFSWARRAAEQGHVKAQVSIAMSYESGVGASQDFQLAFFWYQKAAKKGNVSAQLNLALMYMLRLDVPLDGKQAYAWLSVSAAAGNKTARRQLELAELELDEKALAKAINLASEYIELYSK